MRTVLAACLCLVATGVGAQDLQGRWRITTPDLPSYVGVAMIDAERRAVFADDNGPNWRGYVAHADSMKIEFTVTDGAAVARVFCTVQARDLFQCRTLRPDGLISTPSIMARIGPAPANLMSVPR